MNRIGTILVVLAILSGTLLCGGCAGAGSNTPSDTVRLPRNAGERLGAQLVLLSYMSPTSRTNFLNTFKDSGGGYSRMPDGFEFSWLPVFSGIGEPPARYQNARVIIDTLRQPGKTLFATVYLSLHATGSAFDSQIRAMAADLNANFLPTYAGRANITVCPSLEDYAGDSDFTRWAGIVKGQISSSLLGRIRLRRSGAYSHGAAGPSGFAEITTEYHGGNSHPSNPYSNDGQMVFDSGSNENASSVINQTNGISLGDFQTSIKGNSNVVLLWRPRYNMEVPVPGHSTVVYSEGNRDPYDHTTVFDLNEQRILRLFLKI